MISFVTHNMATGTSETHKRKIRLETTTPGAASHTMRNTGGIFRSALSRACHLGLGGCSEFGMSGLIHASLATSLPQLLRSNFRLAPREGVTSPSTRSASAYVMVKLRDWGQLRGIC